MADGEVAEETVKTVKHESRALFHPAKAGVLMRKTSSESGHEFGSCQCLETGHDVLRPVFRKRMMSTWRFSCD